MEALDTAPVVRVATPDDAGALATVYRPYVEDTVITFEEVPPDAAEMRRRIETILVRYPYLVAESAGRVVGYAYASGHSERVAYRWSVNVSIFLDASVHRRGVGRLLYSTLLPILTGQGFVTAYAGVTLPNPASVGLHEAMGFRPVATYPRVGYKHGQWRDVGWWSRPLNAPVSNPVEPTWWPSLPALR